MDDEGRVQGLTSEKQQDNEEKEPIKVSFSVPQIAGGALAAATAAAIGSQLGVAGTIAGAAVASIVGGVAGTLYSAGIDRTHRRVSDAIVRGYERVRHDPGYDPDRPQVLTADGEDGQTTVLPAIGGQDATRVAAGPLPGGPELDGPEPDDRRKRLWKVMALTVGAMFLVALAAITMIELGLGRSLAGEEGTTVSQVVKPERRPARPSATPSPTPTATATTSTATPTPTPTPAQSPTPTPTTTPAPTPTATGTPEPTAPQTSAAAGELVSPAPTDAQD